MAAIHLTDRGLTTRVRPEARALAQAAVAALSAPSIFNSQPWRWRVSDDRAELYADRARQLRAVDPDGRLLVVSCGIALHHALTALAAKGSLVQVDRLPEAARPDLLATVRLVGASTANPRAERLHAAMTARHTERRPFADQPVPAERLARLGEAAEANGAHLHLLRPDDVASLTVAASRAAAAETADPQYRAELETWTHRGAAAGDGVPQVEREPAGRVRPVPLRDFAAIDVQPVDNPALADRTARYAVLFTDADEPKSWLAAGEAMSAVLLTAVGEGLAASPMSDVAEVPATRSLLRDMLVGIGHPVLAIRVGLPAKAAQAMATPRRPPAELIEVVAEEPAGGRPVPAADDGPNGGD